MKVIFLDMDGVLCIEPESKYLTQIHIQGKGQYAFKGLNKNCIKELNRVTDTTGAKIVLSTMWRLWFREPDLFPILTGYLKDAGVTGDIIGRTETSDEYATPKLSLIQVELPRGQEIRRWLDAHAGEYESFVIVDDMSDMDPLMDNLVQTEFEIGITPEIADRMIRILNVAV